MSKQMIKIIYSPVQGTSYSDVIKVIPLDIEIHNFGIFDYTKYTRGSERTSHIIFELTEEDANFLILCNPIFRIFDLSVDYLELDTYVTNKFKHLMRDHKIFSLFRYPEYRMEQ